MTTPASSDRSLWARLSTLGVLVLALSCAACTSGTETGNPSITGALGYTGYSSDPERYGVGREGTIATVESAWFALDDVEITPEGACGALGGRAIVVPALGVGDHAAGSPNVTDFVADAGAFCNVALPFLAVASDAPGNGLPEKLRGHAILLAGHLPNQEKFSIESDAVPQVVLTAREGGFELSDGAADTIIAFDFATWLEGVDFAAAELDEAGGLQISSASNGALLDAFESALVAGIALYRDRDGDGVLDTEPELLAAPR